MVELGHQFGLYVVKEILSARDKYVCYKAEDPFFNREVVLKVYPAELFALGEKLPKMEKLLENLAVLNHHSIAPIYDSGLEGDSFYYTSGYYNGGHLAAQISAPVPTDQVLRLAAELTQALAYASEHGVLPDRLHAEKIFFDQDGRAVICDFGLVGGIEQLLFANETETEGNPTTQAGDGVVETLHSLGVLLLRVAIGSAADEPADDLLAQVTDPQLKKLLGRLLLPEEVRFSSYTELLAELAKFTPLFVSKPQQAQDLAAYHAPDNRLKLPRNEPADARLSQLLAENSNLQQSLDKAVYNRTLAENKIAEKERELVAAKAASVRLQEEANVAWELVAGQKHERWRPVVWTVGGFVLGFLLSGSFGYYYSEQTRNELLAKMKANEELIKDAVWRPSSPAPLEQANPKPEPVVGAAPVESNVPQVVDPDPVMSTAPSLVVAPVKEVAQQWWPAGNEFSPTAAIPLEQIKAALGLQTVAADEGLPDYVRREVLEIVERWADSWSKQDLGQYFSLYSENYQPELGRSQEEWRDLRRQRLTAPQYIELDIDNIRVRQIDENRIQVKLQQRYRSNFYQDRILKSINLIKENGSWRILKERSLGMLDDIVGG